MNRIHSLVSPSPLLILLVTAALLTLAVVAVSLALLDAAGAEELLGPRLRGSQPTAAEDLRILVAGRFSP